MTKETDNKFIADINSINSIIDEINDVCSDLNINLNKIAYPLYIIRRNSKGNLTAYTCDSNNTISSKDISSIKKLYIDTLKGEKEDRQLRDETSHYNKIMNEIKKHISIDDYNFLNTMYLNNKYNH